ncbi:DMT family transporter [Alkaliphilus peptidifermentans]|uniref:Permease of the drug/metabolite transporter (DMT) superfamily n=1 Tax=Alkaliphilus peptidifermentans DSM 18978 TaxID=1120976 RepID=A0A1G5LAN9_9FIRM|nr:DMT family transporter [Alkaliphilus peptidifermentans]SCZ09955.1 Permease of the drug/metabolite transporter (DMT) superfamily [Alkaliphilus peptidifermentans DSM 18978]
MTKQLKADLALLGVTIIWGSSFVLSKNALDYLPTFNFLAIRFIIAAILSSIVFYKNMCSIKKDTLKYGVLIGLILFGGYALQTVGLNYTTASKSGFITGFSVVIVPVLSALLLKQNPHKEAVIGVILAIFGLGFLTLNSTLQLNIGDLYTLIAAVMFALHIITVGKYTVKVDSIAMAIIQIAVVGILSLFVTFTIETPIIPKGFEIWSSILILSILATSGAFIIQNAMQKFTSPTHTALIYTGEPVFSALFAFILLGERLNRQGVLGSILILSGMLISELDWKRFFAISRKKEASK